MSLRVFYDDASSASVGASLELDDPESHYLLKVRRAKLGATLEVLDGRGGRWHATLQSSTGGQAVLELGPAVSLPEPHRDVTLLLGLPDPKALLDALSAACAGGARAIVLTTTARSGREVPGRDRIDRVLRAALRQCGRPAPPPLSGPLDLEKALALEPELPGLVADPTDASASLPEPRACRLLIGPEGGFAPTERERIERAAFSPLSLGPWTLRTEAAVTAALGRLMA